MMVPSSQTDRLQCETVETLGANVFAKIKQRFLDGPVVQASRERRALPFYRVSRLHWDIHRPSKQKVGRPIRRSCQRYFFELYVKSERVQAMQVRVIKVRDKRKKEGERKAEI